MNVLAELTGKKKHYSKTLILTDDDLIMEWDSPSNKGRKGWHLDYLSPDIGFSIERRRGFKEGVIAGIVLLGIATILYFSNLNQYVPLLVPALVIVSVGILINAIWKYRTETWTVFYKRDGEMAAYMEHSMIDPSDVRSFEKAFSEAMSRHSLKMQNSI
jgi:hypothetical protein